MPQMMPMSWSSLFIMFSTTLIVFAALNYYASIIKSKMNEKDETSMEGLNWKW
uniref:ATP synthase complex subunit 8 n=1 Tax=Cryptotermes sp. 2 AB-2022a TaxID=2942705 RepID=A0A8X8M1Z8_9NEOP|nr:ATP synthase F0 subunit 8 [Cryptotermes sp. 2 AB-2022a]